MCYYDTIGEKGKRAAVNMTAAFFYAEKDGDTHCSLRNNKRLGNGCEKYRRNHIEGGKRSTTQQGGNISERIY